MVESISPPLKSGVDYVTDFGQCAILKYEASSPESTFTMVLGHRKLETPKFA